MKSFRPATILVVLLCLGMLASAGCANFLKPETGAIARPEARIPLPERGGQEQTFSAGDLTIVYSLSGANQPFTLTGTLVFAQSLVYSFPIVSKFFLKMSFLDDQGRVLETTDITPVFGSMGVPDKLDLRVTRVAPPGSRAIAFNYFGVFHSNSLEPGDTWEIYYFPFD